MLWHACINDNLLNQRGTVIHGHEFHFSKIVDIPKDVKFAYKMHIGKGIDGKHDGWIEHEILALHGHLDFAFSTEFAESLIKHCEQYSRK